VHSNWEKDFATCFSTRLPGIVPAPNYIEAYLHACHFPYIDDVNAHVQGAFHAQPTNTTHPNHKQPAPNFTSYSRVYAPRTIIHIACTTLSDFAGCMPLPAYSNPTQYGCVAFERYIQEVLCDPESTRQNDEAWLSYAFSALLNSLRALDKRQPVVRRGLQHALSGNHSQKEYAEKFGEHILPGLMYDQKEAKLHVKELCAAIHRLGWPTYFHTQTCNMRTFPGVAQAYAAIQERELDVRLFLVYLTRVWHRCSLRTQHLESRPVPTHPALGVQTYSHVVPPPLPLLRAQVSGSICTVVATWKRTTTWKTRTRVVQA